MSNLKNILNYLLSESVEETHIDVNPQLKSDVDHLQHMRDSDWSYVDEEDKQFLDKLKRAESVEDFKQAIMNNPLLADEFRDRIDRVAELMNIAKELNNDPLKLDESIEEEKGYSGSKKYKKVVGSGKNKRTVRYGAKGYKIAPGTSKGDSYCARSYGQMKDHPSAAKDPNSPLRLSRKKWRCSGKYSKK
ncbi:hypothetical protein EBU71_19245 [bacterium]|nr:hypothetical protein [Candidatus Elulimicrobium humile]